MLFQLVKEYGIPWKNGINTTNAKNINAGSMNRMFPP
jgi:hypothetical protein